MKSILKKMKLSIIALLFVLAIPLHSSHADTNAPTWGTSIDYVALGDSLAAGVTPNNEIGLGYTDYLAQTIQSMGILQSYNKGFSYPGYTTTDVLKDLQDNVERSVVGIGYGSETTKIQDAITEAKIITISAGANDVLKHVSIDAETGAVTVEQTQLLSALRQVGENLQITLNEIKTLNPDGQVYVMGYYNPFPYLAADVQPLLNQLLQQLNRAILNSTTGTNAIFIETADEIAGDYQTYLPNPANIHLSEAGYQKVTELFWKEMKSYPWIPEDALTANTVTTNSIQLNWKPANSQTTIVNYNIYSGDDKITTVNADTFTYTVDGLAANTDYHFSVQAVDESGNTSTLNPRLSVTTASLESSFSDVVEKDAIEYIERGVALGMVKGYNDGTFKPYNHLTRAQAASILVRTLGLQTDKQAPFTDITKIEKETQAEINAAYAYGLVKGNDGKFMPYNNVTRAQMALMIHRAIEFATDENYTASTKAPYTDFGTYDEETVNAISVLYELEIATGSNGKYMPNNPTSRQQAMKYFVNTLDVLQAAN